mmetsp:Transcript_8343/g.18242  ORF Transcript_8343/g.18242 Transcript_8343/m.18242 type:complete len:432 (-) Transcript_8343:57-1352(-)
MGDTGGRFHSRIGGLPEGNHFPGRGRVGLQGLKGHLPDGDDALVSARPDKLARIPQGLDHRSKNWLPSLSVGPTFKQGLQAKRIVRGHRRSGRRFGGGRSPGRSGGLLSGRLFIFLSLLLFLLSLLRFHEASGALLQLPANSPPDQSGLPRWMLHIGLLTLRKINLVGPGPALHVPRRQPLVGLKLRVKSLHIRVRLLVVWVPPRLLPIHPIIHIVLPPNVRVHRPPPHHHRVGPWPGRRGLIPELKPTVLGEGLAEDLHGLGDVLVGLADHNGPDGTGAAEMPAAIVLLLMHGMEDLHIVELIHSLGCILLYQLCIVDQVPILEHHRAVVQLAQRVHRRGTLRQPLDQLGFLGLLLGLGCGALGARLRRRRPAGFRLGLRPAGDDDLGLGLGFGLGFGLGCGLGRGLAHRRGSADFCLRCRGSPALGLGL